MSFGCQQQSLENKLSSSEESIKIGWIGPLTGEASSYGEMLQKVVQQEIKRINTEGGVQGRNLEIIWEDGKCNAGEAAKAAQKLIKINKVHIILSHCSGETLGIAPITEKEKVLVISPFSSSPEITHAGDFVFRTDPNAEMQSKISAEYANENFPQIGLLYEQADYAVGVIDAFKKYYTSDIKTEEVFVPSESDFKTRVTKLKNSDIDGIFLVTQFPAKFDVIIKQMVEQNWEIPILTMEIATGNEDIIQKYPDFLKDRMVASDFLAPNTDVFQEFTQEYKEKYGEAPAYPAYAATTVDAFRVLKKILSEASDMNDTQELRDALYEIESFPSMFGTLSFDKNGDVNIGYILLRFDGKKFVPLES
ncbi:ABC transporter substrate-binding protein [Candidatus Gracilibacteria bacterium]|nr:ABC transporter substrate-binding protein [Candidatus Gracilibacteria bacterium]